MKKLLATILAVVYLSASVGASLHLHYCMDKLVDWKLWSNGNKEDACSSCGMAKTEANNGCCKDEHKVMKLKDDHRAADGYHAMQLLPALIPSGIFQSLFIDLRAPAIENPTTIASRRSSGLAAYIRNHVLLI